MSPSLPDKLPGKGLVQGLAVTARTLTRKPVTGEYPDVKPDLPPRSRGVIALAEENCTVCMLCARECPDWCIYIDSHKETVAATTEGGRDRTRNVLDRFAIDYSLCMYCSICVEVCPFDALFWSPEFEYAETDVLGLTHERETLKDWMWTVPPPPATDPHAEPPKELATATGTPGATTRGRRTPPAATSPAPAPPVGPGDQVDVPGAGQAAETAGPVEPAAPRATEGDAGSAPEGGGPA